MTHYRTSCCNAPYGVGGEGMTHWYLCTACGQPTHVPGDQEPSEAEMDALWPVSAILALERKARQ
jgi:hypothetical protein